MHSVIAPPRPKQIIAVGKICAGSRDLQCLSRFNPRQVVEHTVNQWTPEKWVAEVRVNGVMTHHSIFSGACAQADAIEWCERIAPMAALTLAYTGEK